MADLKGGRSPEMSRNGTCPRCQSDRVVHGTFVGGPTVGFVPDQTKVFRVSLDSPTISIQRKESFLCIEMPNSAANSKHGLGSLQDCPDNVPKMPP